MGLVSFNGVAGTLPDSFLAAQLTYLRHYRELMRARDVDDHGYPCPHLWHWAVLLQPHDLTEGRIRIHGGPQQAMPPWMRGYTLAIVDNDTGELLAKAP